MILRRWPEVKDVIDEQSFDFIYSCLPPLSVPKLVSANHVTSTLQTLQLGARPERPPDDVIVIPSVAADLNLDSFRTMFARHRESLGFPIKLCMEVLDGIRCGWPSLYEGPRNVFQDHSIPLPHVTETAIRDNLLKYRRLGLVLGPFALPPFPCSWCPHEPIIARLFSIPKDKWDPVPGETRSIVNKSFPPGVSVNDLTPRSDRGIKYYTIRDFLRKAADAGSGALMFACDVRYAYKLAVFKPIDWHLQVLHLRGFKEFWVDKSAGFGHVRSGDIFHVLWFVIEAILRLECDCDAIDAYVDNVDVIVPPSTDLDRISTKLMKTLRVLGVPFHEVITTTTRFERHLGWMVDTVLQVAALCPVRVQAWLTFVTSIFDRASASVGEVSRLVAILYFTANVYDSMRSAADYCNKCLGAFQKAADGKARRHFRLSRQFLCGIATMIDLLTTMSPRPLRLFGTSPPTVLCMVDAGLQAVNDVGERWGMGATFTDVFEGCEIKTPAYFYASVIPAEHDALCVRHGSPYLELLNYVTAIQTVIKRLGLHGVVLEMTGDCEPALFALEKRFSAVAPMQQLIAAVDRLCFIHHVVLRIVCKPRAYVYYADLLARAQVELFLTMLQEDDAQGHPLEIASSPVRCENLELPAVNSG